MACKKCGNPYVLISTKTGKITCFNCENKCKPETEKVKNYQEYIRELNKSETR